jgi:hypothetical protein
MYGLLLATWATAFLGTGTLSAVPGSVMMMVMMGVLFQVRSGSGLAQPGGHR